MKDLRKTAGAAHEVGEAGDGQRIDNYLARLLKGVPRSHLYKILRSGEVRVNGRRVDATARLKSGDSVRVPPVRTAVRPGAQAGAPPRPRVDLTGCILFEDDDLIAIAKPPGLAVHGGSGVARGLIEELRLARPQARFLELVHRLDRDTSGVLLIAKRRAALTALHTALREGRARKHYTVLVLGHWQGGRREVSLPLLKFVRPDGERRVRVDHAGLPSTTVFTPISDLAGFTMLDARLLTGRTHQIRVHLAHSGHPIAGDDKYGDFPRNRELARRGLVRMFLHAARLTVPHPSSGEALRLEAPLSADLSAFLARLGAGEGGA